jgi:predicted nicotinamide N-methyase
MPVSAQQQQSFSFGTIRVQLLLPQLPERSSLPAMQEDGTKDTFLYWAKLWPSAIALSQYVAGQPHLVAGKKVLELAAGLGLPGIVAAHMAREVIISDYMPEAVSVMQSSVALNGLSNVQCRLLDWNGLPADPDADVLLLSDINYEPAAFEILYAVLMGFLAKGTVILLATPQRLMAKPFVERLLSYCVAQEEQLIDLNGESSFISVFVLAGSEGIDRDFDTE